MKNVIVFRTKTDRVFEIFDVNYFKTQKIKSARILLKSARILLKSARILLTLWFSWTFWWSFVFLGEFVTRCTQSKMACSQNYPNNQRANFKLPEVETAVQPELPDQPTSTINRSSSRNSCATIKMSKKIKESTKFGQISAKFGREKCGG